MLYENIVKLCERDNIPISRLERECGLGNATIRGWQNGSARIDKVKPVADYFGVTVDELLREPAEEAQKGA